MESNATGPSLSNLSLPIKTALGILFGLSILLALVGNVLVCVAIACDRSLRKNENLFLISLAVSDILVAVLIMTFAGINDIYGKWLFGSYCSIWIKFDVMFCTASILNLAAVSFDRYLHIKYSMKYATNMTRGKILGAILAVWCTAAGISFIPFTGDDLTPVKGQCLLTFDPTYTLLSSTVSFFLPSIILLIAYFRMYMIAHQHVNMLRQQYQSIGTTLTVAMPQDSGGTPKKTKRSTPETGDHKARVTVGLITGIFLASWVPFFCVNVVRGYHPDIIPIWAFQLVTWIGYMNSTANPIIYTICSRDFRLAFHKILCLRRCRDTQLTSSLSLLSLDKERRKRREEKKRNRNQLVPITRWRSADALNANDPVNVVTTVSYEATTKDQLQQTLPHEDNGVFV